MNENIWIRGTWLTPFSHHMLYDSACMVLTAATELVDVKSFAFAQKRGKFSNSELNNWAKVRYEPFVVNYFSVVDNRIYNLLNKHYSSLCTMLNTIQHKRQQTKKPLVSSFHPSLTKALSLFVSPLWCEISRSF